ncbi:LytTR family DNA-binding domain-containing protein [Aquimarina sp. 2201CG5-10]|uniref:LytR/AlgR family response regulator transcription factor n=1 Tax=Aquimarina callyspongiae TaxID=3098150 RepID=UPI002AC93A23|nr:LytTR family DNA-binding domain-containing protein [Aquimarina sp. 2201CG5-10]
MYVISFKANSQNCELALKYLRAFEPIEALEEIDKLDNYSLSKKLITFEANYLIDGTVNAFPFAENSSINEIEDQVLYNLFYGDYLRRISSKKPENTAGLKQQADKLYTEALILSEKLNTIYKNESLWRVLDYFVKNSSRNKTDFKNFENYLNEFNKINDPNYAFWKSFFRLNYKIIVTSETKKRIAIENNAFLKLRELTGKNNYLLGRSLQLEALYYDIYFKNISESLRINYLAYNKYKSVPYFYSQYRSETIKLNIGYDLKSLDRKQEAKKVLLSILSDSIFENSEKLHKSDVFEKLIEIYKKEDKKDSVIFYSEEYINNEREVGRFEVAKEKDKNARRFNFERLKKTIARNSKYFILSLIGVLLIALYSVFRWKKSDKAKKRIDIQLHKLIEKEKSLRNKIVESENEKIDSDKEVKLLRDEIEQTIQEIERLKRITILEHIVLINGVRLPVSDLMYIKADGHFLHFFTKDNREFVIGTLKKILNHLPPNFIQAHRSYIVNLNYIYYSDSMCLRLKDKTEIPIGRTYKTEVKKMIELSNALK